MSDVLDLYARNVTDPGRLRKALNEANSDYIPPKGAIIDPINQAGYGGTREKPTPVPYSTLRKMAKIPAVSAIINTRLNQVARFAKRPRYNGDTGFKIVMKDKERKMGDKEKKRAKEIEEFFLRTGWEKNKVRKDNFNTFLRKIVRDSLTLDVVTFEKVGTLGANIKGKQDVAEVWALDGATIELVLNNPIGEGADYEVPVYKPVTSSGRDNIGDLAYVQRVNGVVIAEFTEDELAFAVRNPSTDLDYVDFGMSELEVLMEIVTGIVNGTRYNTSYFSHSHLPQGVLEMIGKYKDEHLQSFKRHWKTLTDGASGKWSVPVMALEEGNGFKFTPFKNSNKDMEFNEFLEFLFNVACAVYQIDPNEVGFKSWTSGSGMNQSDNTQAKIDSSQDKGFHPLMDFLADTFNSEIVDLIDEDFVFEWVGVSDEDEDKKLERQKSEIDSGIKTVAMIWAENDVDIEAIKEQNGGELPAWVNAPANAQLIQVFMNDLQQEQAEKQQAQQQEQEGMNRQNQLEDEDAGHKRQLEVMDRQHQQGLEAKKMDHEHQHGLAKLTAQQKAQQDAQKKKQSIQKSIENDFRSLGVEIDWGDY